MELKTYDEFFKLFKERQYGKTNDEKTSFPVSDKVNDRGYANGKYDWNCFDSFNNVELVNLPQDKDKPKTNNNDILKVKLQDPKLRYVIQPLLSVWSFQSLILFIFSIFIILLTVYLLYTIYYNYPKFSNFCKLLNLSLRDQQSIIRILFFGMLMCVFLLLLIFSQYNVLASKINNDTITSTQIKALIIALFLFVCWIIIWNSKNAVRFITNHKTSLYYLITASFLLSVLVFVLFKNYSLTFLLLCCISVIVFCIHVLPLFFSPIMFRLIPSWFTFVSKISDKTNTTDSEEENEKSIKEFISNIFFLCIFGLWWVIPLWSGIFLKKFFDPDDSYNVHKQKGGDLSINMYGGVFSSPDANKFLKIQPIIGFFTSWFQPIPKNDPKLFMADVIASTIISNTAPTSKFQINVDKDIFKTTNMGNDMWTTIKWGFLKEMPLIICCLLYMTKMANFCNLCRDTRIKFENMEQQKVEFQKKILSLKVSNNVKSIIFYSLRDHDSNEILFFNQKFPLIQKILEEKQNLDMKNFQDLWTDYYAKNYIHFINLINFYYTLFKIIVLLTLCLLVIWIFNTCYFLYAVFQNENIPIIWLLICIVILGIAVGPLLFKWLGEKIF